MNNTKYLILGLPFSNSLPNDENLKEFIKTLKITKIAFNTCALHLSESEYIELRLKFPNLSVAIWDYDYLIEKVKNHRDWKYGTIDPNNFYITFQERLKIPETYSTYSYYIDNFFR